MSKFFINRPIVAMVISILLVIVGAVTIAGLPVAQFPAIAPPEVQIQANYVGADAQTVEQSVATPIEQQMSGVDNLNYMFTNFGITVQKSVTAPLMLISLYSPKGTYDARFLANYSYINLNDQFTRVSGIGSVQVFGAGQYAMRLWVKPDQLAKLGITVPEIVSAIQAQNTVNPAGQVGGAPVPKGQEELGAQDYTIIGRLNGKPGAIIALYQLPGSNAVQAAAGVKKLMAEVKNRFPEDMDYVVSLDTTRAVTEGIKEIVITLVIAILLVILVVYVFLQGWRATLIPLLAVPVSLIGTFVFFPLFLVVDDAIVVVEAVERHIEDGLAPKEAALKAMEEISGPVVGIALVLSAVFVPTAFIPGITGRLYQQFAVTIAISVILSAFNALTLSPALAALLLKPKEESHGLLRRFFDWFNRVFKRATDGYVRFSGALIHKSAVALVVLVGFGLAAGFFSSRVPSSFLPDEDQGYMFMHLQLPNAASLERTDAACRKIENILAKMPGVKYTTTVAGFSLLSFVRTSYNGLFFITLKEWGDRKSREEQYHEILQRLNLELSKLPDGFAFGFSPPAIPGVGTSGGFTFVLEDRAGKDVQFLATNLGTFMGAVRKRPEIGGLVTTFLPSVPQQFVNVDRDKVIKQGVPLNDVYRTIQAFMGGLFVNYFNRFGRQWQVYIEAEGDYRTKAENVGQFYVRNSGGEMVPLSAVTKFESRPGPEFTMRYNLYRSAEIIGSSAPGYSSEQAMKALEDVFAKTMPREMGYDYMGMSFQEKKAQEACLQP